MATGDAGEGGRGLRVPALRVDGAEGGRADPASFAIRLVDVAVVAAFYANAGVRRAPHAGRGGRETWFAACDGPRAMAVQGLMPGGGRVPYLGVDVALDADAVLLGGLLVDPAFRKRGVATRTIAAVLDYAAVRGYRRAVALVLPENAAGLSLLQSLGFAATGCVRVAGRGRMRVVVRRPSRSARTAVLGARAIPAP
jgi:GNAT superfamily N-acetyltransferase